MQETKILRAESARDMAVAATLLREYAEWLEFDLSYQGFEDEVSTLPGKYAPPSGALLLAFIGDVPAGMIAMRRIGDGVCEMKRLYVRPEARGHKLGRVLIMKIIDEARKAGYSRMRLDTVAGKMDQAIALYKEFGFREIDAYYPSPVQHTVVLEAELESAREAAS